MRRKIALGIMLTLLLVGVLTLAFDLVVARVDGYTSIRADSSSASSEPPATQWNKTYGGDDDDWGDSVQQTSDGGYIVAGWTAGYDFWLVKTNATGNMQWNKTYGGADDDWANSIQQTSDGGYIVAGGTKSFGAGMSDFWLVMADASGNMIWNKTYGGIDTDWACSVQQTSDGGYIVAGMTMSFGAGSADSWLVKTDGSGNHQWNKTYGGDDDDRARSVQQTSDGGYVVAGYTHSFGASWSDFWLVRTDAGGNVEWNKTYGGVSGDVASSVRQTSDGGYALAGETDSFGAGKADFWLIKLAPPPPPVGGIWIPVDKLALLTPWIILAAAAVAITITLAYAKKRWTGKAVAHKQK